jgi:uncharacterized protein involved in response to NO
MRLLPTVSDPKTKQAEFQIGYIWVALATAVIGGFAVGAYLAFVIGYALPLGSGFYSFIQTHGHVQLVGWAGLFIIGISLHFIPRLASVPISRPQWVKRVLWLMASGLLLRTIGHTVLPYLAGSFFFVPVNWLVAGSGLLEWFGILAYVALLVRTLRGVGGGGQPALHVVRPFFAMMLSGWIIYASLNLILLVQMAMAQEVVVNRAWNEFAIQVFVGLVLLPVAFGFSVRMFPLFLTLRAPDWPVRGIAYAYLLSLSLQVVPRSPFLPGLAPEIVRFLSSLGMVFKGGVIVWFVWELGILTRRREPWTVKQAVQPDPDRRPTRPGLPDYEELGRFERLVYAAYAWLVLAALFEVLLGGTILLGYRLPVGTDVIRHMYLLGFITHLIFGVSVRAIPGLLRKRCVFSVALVDATFWLGNTAAICRVLPLIVPPGVFEAIPASILIARSAFAFSGIIGLGAVLCLAINLWKTSVQ